VTRRKSVVAIMLLMLAVLLTSPWASAPKPDRLPETTSQDPDDVDAEPVFAEQTAELNVKIVEDEEPFNLLAQQSAEYERSHPDIRVKLERIDPAAAPDLLNDWRHASGDADAALVPSIWVKRLAVSGGLLTADAAFVGDALSQQFEALTAPLKWNGYLWGVPHHMDPYVIVWNRARLSSVPRPDGSPMTLPLTQADWPLLAASLAQEGARPWLAIDERDPAALLTWIGAATGLRPDLLLTGAAGDWSAGPAGALIETLGASAGPLRAPERSDAFWQAMRGGQYAAAVMRLSYAEAGIAGLSQSEAAGLSIDRSSWDKPYAFEAGASFVINASTENESAARSWIAAMTEERMQLDTREKAGYLPVYRSAYVDHGGLPNMTGRTRQQFPNWEPSAGPDWPLLMEEFERFWYDWRQGRLTLSDWPARWSGLLADLQLHD